MANNDEHTPLLQSGDTEHGSLLSNNTLTNHGSSLANVDHDSTQLNTGQILMGRNFDRSPSVEKVHQIALSWKDINVSVRVPSKRKWCRSNDSVEPTKQVLKDISGIVHPGSLLAIMGASGAGKSTLLNVLTHRNTKSYVFSGDIRLNGWNVGDGIKNVSAYVQQDDLFIDTLTVREQLQFRALLRMDRRLDKSARLARVEEVIIELGLTNCADTRIGTPGGGKKGISGGERKRLSFASEALTNPPIFFCDEPTSGLDTFMAQNLVHTLQEMAEKGRTILCTIHQPSSDLFALFNKILLLSEGRTVFLGSPDGAIEFFERHNYPCPKNYNPADHFIFTLAVIPGQEEECRRKTQVLCDKFATGTDANSIAWETENLIKTACDNKNDPLLDEVVTGESRYKASWLTQYRYLFWRSWISVYRDVVLFRIRIMQAFVLGVVLGLVYLQLTVDQKGVMNINGAIFLLITNTSFSNMFGVVNSFPHELAIFLREYGTGLYRADVYYFTKSIAELPVFCAITILYTTVTYWMMGLYASWDAFLIATGVLLLTANVAVSLGYLLATLCASVTVALAIAPPILIPFMLFGGLFVNNGNIPVYFIWLQALSWFRYANEVLMVNQWQNVHNITCHLQESNATNENIRKECMYTTGDDVLEYTSFSKDNVVLDIGLMVALIVGFRAFSLLFLIVRARRSKE
ncbi:unnamed protein product [Candidula unifasciata]|uniref:ABC transporter domain-containing protein n=1 Tax=Candidula unifasciata TaxID=100452 RepID=A0A8S3ZL18_9EUPU|nr:unnamed protein product [Candidula unifasciata]